MIGEDDEPILYCAWDNSTFKPGSGFWTDVRAVVSEHYLE
jgi:hypothetical protein